MNVPTTSVPDANKTKRIQTAAPRAGLPLTCGVYGQRQSLLFTGQELNPNRGYSGHQPIKDVATGTMPM